MNIVRWRAALSIDETQSTSTVGGFVTRHVDTGWSATSRSGAGDDPAAMPVAHKALQQHGSVGSATVTINVPRQHPRRNGANPGNPLCTRLKERVELAR